MMRDERRARTNQGKKKGEEEGKVVLGSPSNDLIDNQKWNGCLSLAIPIHKTCGSTRRCAWEDACGKEIREEEDDRPQTYTERSAANSRFYIQMYHLCLVRVVRGRMMNERGRMKNIVSSNSYSLHCRSSRHHRHPQHTPKANPPNRVCQWAKQSEMRLVIIWKVEEQSVLQKKGFSFLCGDWWRIHPPVPSRTLTYSYLIFGTKGRLLYLLR